MSSIVKLGNFQAQHGSRNKPIKENSILELLQNSEIEFQTCQKLPNNLNNFNTGFGENNDLHYEPLCNQHKLNTPLYRENYLQEFSSEEEKASARHALGIYNKGDIVAMSLLTAQDELPSKSDWDDYTIKQMRKGDRFFTPVTSFSAVYDSQGVTLEVRIKETNQLISEQQKQITKITQVSKEEKITSLGDVKAFLQGFNNGDNLYDTLEDINQEMLRFEATGYITN